MAPEQKQIKLWRKYYQQSRRAMPVALALLLLECGVLLVISLGVNVPLWAASIAFIVIGVGIFSVVMEGINILYLRRKLRAAAEGEAASEPPSNPVPNGSKARGSDD